MNVNARERTRGHQPDDGELVDLLSSVLADPNLHTDQRMQLYQHIEEILRATHEDLYGEAAGEVHQRTLKAHGDHLPDLLGAVLVDPNLYTDRRMRLHREIRALLDRPHDPQAA